MDQYPNWHLVRRGCDRPQAPQPRLPDEGRDGLLSNPARTVATQRKYRNALSALYNRLNGRNGYNPTREVLLPREPQPLPRGVPYARIEQILSAMRPSATRARLATMAYFGIRPSEIARMQPQDLGADAVVVRTGKGGHFRVVPVAGAGAMEAIAELKRLKAFGKAFSTSSVYKSWKLAQAKTGSPLGGLHRSRPSV